MRPLMIAPLLALAAIGTLDLFGPDGQRVGIIREGPGGQVEVLDRDSRRVAWGRRGADGSLELFDQQGRRLGVVTGDGKALWLEGLTKHGRREQWRFK